MQAIRRRFGTWPLALTVLALFAAFVVAGGISPSPVYAATITVNSNADNTTASDSNCTLREAITNANANADTTSGDCTAGSGTDTINFSGNLVISLSSGLPDITDPVIIDGTGFVITLDGSATTGATDGLVITGAGGGSTVKGLIIMDFARNGVFISTSVGNTIGYNVLSNNAFHGVLITGAASTGNVVKGNFIGTDAGGTVDQGNSKNGVFIFAGTGNTIGGTTTPGACDLDCNVISGNASRGIDIQQTTAPGNEVKGNFIGLDVSGATALPNGAGGVRIVSGLGNTIGGATAPERNVISGNTGIGVYLFDDANGNVVKGNFIGTDSTGVQGRGNLNDGVRIQKSSGNTIGGTTAAEGNVISDNNGSGVFIFSNVDGAPANNNLVHANLIGTQVDGTSPLGNISVGVRIQSFPGTGDRIVTGNVIGGTGAEEGNTIAFNNNGVSVDGAEATGNPIRGNSIHSNTGLGINNVNGGNTELAPPTITSASGVVSGTACANCTVDVYSDAADEGKDFEGTTMADGSGAWSFPGAVTGPNITATATDAAGNGNTSEFSAAVAFGTTACQLEWPVDTVTTIAKGQSPTNNPKVQNAITGHIVGGAAAFGPKAHRIRICEGTPVSINITDSTGTPTNTALSAGITCDSSGCAIPSLTATEKYKAVSNDGKDTDRVTLLPGIDY